MRLFFYYFTHTLLNTVKKLMKTWVAIIVVMMIFGCLMGLIGSVISSMKEPDTVGNTVVTESVEDDEEIILDEDIDSAIAKIQEVVDKGDMKLVNQL